MTNARQTLLGLFVTGQLVFLFAFNGIEMLREARPEPPDVELVDELVPGWPAGKGHAWEAVDQAWLALRRWVQLTGQEQSWALFAPTVNRWSWFPAVELGWDGAQPTYLLKSENEPADPTHYVRFGNYRERRFESNLLPSLMGPPGPETAARWRMEIEKHVQEHGMMMRAYLRRRYETYFVLRSHAVAPKSLTLVERRYDVTNDGWVGPTQVPILRWRRAEDELERYDPVAGTFEKVAP